MLKALEEGIMLMSQLLENSNKKQKLKNEPKENSGVQKQNNQIKNLLEGLTNRQKLEEEQISKHEYRLTDHII